MRAKFRGGSDPRGPPSLHAYSIEYAAAVDADQHVTVRGHDARVRGSGSDGEETLEGFSHVLGTDEIVVERIVRIQSDAVADEVCERLQRTAPVGLSSQGVSIFSIAERRVAPFFGYPQAPLRLTIARGSVTAVPDSREASR